MAEETKQPEIMEGGGYAIEAIERAQIDMQIATAKRWPRTLSKVKEDMMSMACLDEETAAACFYSLPRGGKVIQGPSVRLAEIAISSFGNIRAATRILLEDSKGANPHVVVQAMTIDLERNSAVSIEKRRRIVKKKSKTEIDDDDINLAVNACTAIALRDAAFKVVPRALILPVYEAAKKCAVGNLKSIAAKRSQVVDRLKTTTGLTEDRILHAVAKRKIDDIGATEIEILIGLGTALKDGDTTLEEAFPPIEKPAAFDTGAFTAPKPAPVTGHAMTLTPADPADELPYGGEPSDTTVDKDGNTVPAGDAWDQAEAARLKFEAAAEAVKASAPKLQKGAGK